MLKRLRVVEFALIDEVEVELGPGLNVLTGETGAGKSILVDSLALLLGARASTDSIRQGADHATIEGLFQSAEREVVVRRDLFRDRTNRCYLDGGLSTARMVAEEGERWVDLHGQHEDRLLVKAGVQRDLLDQFAGADGIAAEVRRAARELRALEDERATLEAAGAERERRVEYLRSQVQEIEDAALEPGEEERLAAEATRLGHAAERQRLAGELYERLEGGDPALVGELGAAERAVARLAEIDPGVAPLLERLASARYEIEDLARELAGYAESVEHDPRRLSEIEERRDLLFRLGRKHGGPAETILERGREMAAELARLESDDVRVASMDREIGSTRELLEERAGALADARELAADRLEAAVRDRLAELGMGDGTFEVELVRAPDPDGLAWSGGRWGWSAAGLEQVRFLIAPNAGEAPRPLSRIASGGELSRVLLALEAALAEGDRTPTLVFDEVDAGIGGVVAHHVADQLKSVAGHHQVVVVTHLAQIAAAADRHLLVEKKLVDGRTLTTVRPVEREERVREVSRLLGGDPEREVSRHHAEELLAGRA